MLFLRSDSLLCVTWCKYFILIDYSNFWLDPVANLKILLVPDSEQFSFKTLARGGDWEHEPEIRGQRQIT